MTSRRTSLIICFCAVAFTATAALPGCSAPCPTHGSCYETGRSGHETNLVLGIDRREAMLAQSLAGRSDWPSIHAGYRFDGPTTFLDVTLDDEFFYDEFGGSFFRTRQSTASGAVLR